MSLENCKLKQLSNIPLEWQRCQTVTTLHTDGNVEQKKLSSIAEECRLVQPLWQFLTRLTIILPCNLAITLLGIYPNTFISYVHISSEILLMDVYGSLIYNFQNLEVTKMSFSGPMVK